MALPDTNRQFWVGGYPDEHHWVFGPGTLFREGDFHSVSKGVEEYVIASICTSGELIANGHPWGYTLDADLQMDKGL